MLRTSAALLHLILATPSRTWFADEEVRFGNKIYQRLYGYQLIQLSSSDLKLCSRSLYYPFIIQLDELPLSLDAVFATNPDRVWMTQWQCVPITGKYFQGYDLPKWVIGDITIKKEQNLYFRGTWNKFLQLFHVGLHAGLRGLSEG